MPIMGVYGIVQYLAPSLADQFWMRNTPIDSIGSPEPGMVRVFSTMNSPASLACFLISGLMLVGFLRGRIGVVIACAPAAVTLLLSQVRSAWIALAIAIGYTLFFRATALRATMIALTILVAGVFAVVATPLGDVIQTRLQTLSASPGDDGSARVRFQEFALLLEHAEDHLIGYGEDFSGVSHIQGGVLTVQASDGMIINHMMTMGLVVGLICIFVTIWIAVQAVGSVGREAGPEFVIAASLVLGNIAVCPLTDPTGAEIGLLFWSFIAVCLRIAPDVAWRPARDWGRGQPAQSRLAARDLP